MKTHGMCVQRRLPDLSLKHGAKQVRLGLFRLKGTVQPGYAAILGSFDTTSNSSPTCFLFILYRPHHGVKLRSSVQVCQRGRAEEEERRKKPMWTVDGIDLLIESLKPTNLVWFGRQWTWELLGHGYRFETTPSVYSSFVSTNEDVFKLIHAHLTS